MPKALAIALFAALATGSRKTPEIVPADAAGVLKAVRRPGAKAVLVNVWATWCEPCREEMPDILRLYRENKTRGFRLVLVSGDSRDEKAAAAKYLRSLGVDFRSFLKVGDDMAFIDGLDRSWDGTLPVSFLYDGAGRPLHTWRGKVEYQALRDKLNDVLQHKVEEQRRKP